MLVNYMREYELAHGADQASAYQSVLHVIAGLLLIGFVANLMVRPVARKYWMAETPSPGTTLAFDKTRAA